MHIDSESHLKSEESFQSQFLCFPQAEFHMRLQWLESEEDRRMAPALFSSPWQYFCSIPVVYVRQ